MSSAELLIIASHWPTIWYITAFSLKFQPKPSSLLASVTAQVNYQEIQVLKLLKLHLNLHPVTRLTANKFKIITSHPSNVKLTHFSMIVPIAFTVTSYSIVGIEIVINWPPFPKLHAISPRTQSLFYTIHIYYHLSKSWMDQCAPMSVFLIWLEKNNLKLVSLSITAKVNFSGENGITVLIIKISLR